MFDFNTLALFSIASLLLALSPGPDNIFVLTQSMAKGSKSGLIVTLGLCSGLVFHTGAVALGVAAIFQTSQMAFALLKYVGAGYLLYLAYLSFKENLKKELHFEKKTLPIGTLYRRGIFMNITNPKVSIFFLAFLPQFTQPANGSITLQIVILGGVFMLCALIVFSLIALLAGRIGGWFSRTKNGETVLNRIAGGIFVALAIKLALSEK